MEELKLLVEMVASLPQMALWVIAFFFIYKVVVIGSIYGVIRFCVGKIHDMVVRRRYQEIEPLLRGHCITGTVDNLMAQLLRLKPMSYRNYKDHQNDPYIHGTAVDWLRQAIDDKIEKDQRDKTNE